MHVLILPICLYVLLATAALVQAPRLLSSIALTCYLGSIALATGGFVILGTTHTRTAAEYAAVFTVFMAGWSFAAFLPLTILSLYWPAGVNRHRRFMLGLILSTAVSEILFFAIVHGTGTPWVYQIDNHHWAHWMLHVRATSPAKAILTEFANLGIGVLAIGWVFYQKRLTLWRGAVALTLMLVASVLLLYLAPLGGTQRMLVIAPLSYLPPALFLSVMVLRAGRGLPLESLIATTLQTAGDHLILLDMHRQVLWHNLHTASWIDTPPQAAPGALALSTLLARSPIQPVVSMMLDDGHTTQTSALNHAGDDYVLYITIQPLSATPRHLARTQIIIQDVTTAHVRRNLEERSLELRTLSRISVTIAALLNVDQIVNQTLRALQTITSAETVLVYLRDAKKPQIIHLAGTQGPVLDTVPAQFSADVLPDDSLMRQMLIAPDTLIIQPSDPDTPIARHLQRFGGRSAIFVSLSTTGAPFGVLIAGKNNEESFSPLEVTVLESIGRQVAVAIENARLHAQERAQRHFADVLRQVVGTLSSPSLDQALDRILTLLREVLDYERATVLIKAEPGTLRLGAYTGLVDPDPVQLSKVRVQIAHFPYLGKLFEERTSQLVTDTAADPRWEPGEHGAPSWMGIPLIGHQDLLGCLSISHPAAGHFTSEDLQTATTFAAQVSIVLENAQLLAVEQQNRMRAERMQNATFALVTSPDMNSALQTVLDHLGYLIPYDQAHIGLIDETNQGWTYHAGRPPVPPENVTKLNRQMPGTAYPLIGTVFDTKQPLLVPETRLNKLWRESERGGPEIRCWLGVPLVVRDRAIGLINLDSFEPHTFDQDTVQSVQVFAHQVAAALENFQLLSETRRQNRALSALNTVLSASNEALTHENMLGVMLVRLLETLDLPAGLIHQYRPSAHELQLRAAHGLSESARESFRVIPFNMTTSDNTPAQLTLLPQELHNITLPTGETLIFTSVPLVAHGVAIGLLSIAQPDTTPIPADFRALLTNIGQQLGVVMDNATLFETTTRRVTLSTDLGRLSLALSTQLDREAVLHLVCRESLSIFDVQGAYIWLMEGNHLIGQVGYGPGADLFVGHTVSRADEKLVINYTLNEWRPHYVNHVADTQALPADFLQMTRAQSVLAVPLLRAEVPLGTLLLINTEQPNAFAGWLLEQIGMLGVQAALAIQNATLFDAVRRRLDQLRLVNETGRYTTAILSPQELIEGIAQKLSDTLHYDSVGLLQIEDQTLTIQSFFTGGTIRPVSDLPDLKPTLITLAENAIQHAEPVLGEIGSQPPGNALSIPLIVADEVIGVLFVARTQPQMITAEDLDVLEPLATQLAISVSNARLFEKVRQQAIDLEARVAQRTREIRQQHERTEAILRSVADAVIVFDLQGQVVLTNPTARQLFDEHDLDMNLGKRVGDLAARALDIPNSHQSTTDIIELRGTVLQANTARVVEGERLLGSVVVLRDISQLSHLDRMKDMFVSNVSHELRTPLANLKLYLSLLEQGRPDRRAGYLTVMGREIQRLTRLIDDLLQISRLEGEARDERPQMRQSVHLDTLIDSVVQSNLARAEAEHKELGCEHQSGPLPPIVGDPDQLIRAITNLISNAVNYTPEGGYIAVHSRVTQTKPEWVIIEVVDTGIGIPADDLPHIFDRFHRGSNVSSSAPGTGLGLAIIKEIVELHHGKIEVESEEGQGSTFRLWLPVTPYQGED